jgi:hypothetical protein
VPASAQETSGKLDADLQRLRDYSTAIAELLEHRTLTRMHNLRP